MANGLTRRTFLGGAAGVAAASSASSAAASSAKKESANGRINVGMIAAGARAQQLLDEMNRIDGVEVAGVCDAYTGRVERAVDRTGGRAKVYANYREIIEDPSIDVVTVASPDHHHKRHVIDALNAGKDVYCEKPLTYAIDEGLAIREAVRKSGRLLQVGSQHMSSVTYRKAREIIRAGKLGQITMIRAGYNRNTAGGAWIYPIPPDASPETVNWEMFLGGAKKRPFDLERFFRWRCYRDYSGGIPTDLFVHLCTTIHFLMDAKMPSRVTAMGQLYRWKESRNVPDTMNAILEYPEGFAVNLSSTFNNQFSAENSFLIMGTEGTISLGYRSMKFHPENVHENNSWIVRSWPKELERQYYQDAEIRKEELTWTREPEALMQGEEFEEQGESPTLQHLRNFFSAVRDRSKPEEDEVAGHRAAACAHLINYSAEKGEMALWDFDNDRQKL